jgi:hypothetical protein
MVAGDPPTVVVTGTVVDAPRPVIDGTELVGIISPSDIARPARPRRWVNWSPL